MVRVLQRAWDRQNGVLATLREAQDESGYVAITSRSGLVIDLVARAQHVRAKPSALEMLADRRAAAQGNQARVVRYLRDDPIGIPPGNWLWLSGVVEVLGGQHGFAAVLLDERDDLGEPPALRLRHYKVQAERRWDREARRWVERSTIDELGLLSSLDEAQDRNGYAVVVSSVRSILYVAARAKEVDPHASGVQTLADRLAATLRFRERSSATDVKFLRDDPVGIPTGNWLWLNGFVLEVGWQNAFSAVLRGRQDDPGEPPLRISTESLARLLRDYDERGPLVSFVAYWIEGKPELGPRGMVAGDDWNNRCLVCLGRPPGGHGPGWHASTLALLLHRYRPGWADAWPDRVPPGSM